jgi:hypothetical protein
MEFGAIFGGIVYIQTVQSRNQDGILWHPWLYFSGRGHLAFNRNFECSTGQELANNNNKLDDSSLRRNYESLYKRPRCQLVSKAFLTSNKTAGLHDPKASYTELSCYNVHESQNDFPIASSDLQRAVGLCVEYFARRGQKAYGK